MFSEIINPFLNVRNKIKDRNDNWVDMKKPREVLKTNFKNRIEISGDENYEVFNVFGKKVILDMLMWGSEGEVYPRLMIEDVPYDTATNLLHTIQRGGGWSATSPTIINNVGSDIFELLSYESEDRKGTVYLRQPIILPEGGKLAFARRGSIDPCELTFKVVWREIEE